MKDKIVTDTKTRTFGEDVVVAEISDTEEHFCFRLRVNEEVGPWCFRYESVITLNNYGLAMGYWEGTLPTEEPFKITTGQLK